jgi:ferric-dicitrate binding protein FerR (iron transport regulator)
MNKEVFIKYFRNELSETEEKALFAWIEENESNKQTFLNERKLWDLILLNTPPNHGNITIETVQQKNTANRWIRELSKIAAIFVLAALIGGLYVKNRQPNEVQIWNTIEIPIGQRACITLTDGTKVWLNAKSKFSFPDKFLKNKREVKLDGEAVFDVAHKEVANFVVKTKRFNVRVLGTKFNVYAYDNSQIFETTLVRGKISLENTSSGDKPLILSPNEMAVYNDNIGKVQVKTVDTKESLYWTEGVYSFDNQPLSAIIQRLERYYEVSITVKNPELLKNKYTGKFRYSDPIEVILEVVRKNTFFRYKKLNSEIIIY